MADIIPIHGGADPREPVADLIEDIKSLLARAESGEIRALAWALVNRDNSLNTGWCGEAGTRYPVGVATSLLSTRYLRALADQSEEKKLR